MTNLTDPIFTNEDAARHHFEAIHWPNGPVCPHCGAVNEATLMTGKSHRVGLYQCNSCREPFTITLGTVMERSHIPLHKWALGFHLMAASKKGMSAHQLHRMLGVTYKAAWFMAHRIREAMREPSPDGQLGGEGKFVEADESYIGGRSRNRAYRNPPPKESLTIQSLQVIILCSLSSLSQHAAAIQIVIFDWRSQG